MSESPEEVQLRLQQERRTRQIADTITPMLPPGSSFLLLVATIGEGIGLEDTGPRFASTSYVSTFHREDAQRLLQEFLDQRIAPATGRLGEPTIETSTRLREHVHRLLNELDVNQIKARAARALADARQGSDREQAVAALTLAAYALALFELKAVALTSKPDRGAS